MSDTNNKYLLLYRNSVDMAPKPPSPEEMQQMMAQWESWKSRFAANMVDMGDGLERSGRVLKGGEVSDGPFVEAKEIIGGFSLIQAQSYDEAIEVAKACPVNFVPGTHIEIRQLSGY